MRNRTLLVVVALAALIGFAALYVLKHLLA